MARGRYSAHRSTIATGAYSKASVLDRYYRAFGTYAEASRDDPFIRALQTQYMYDDYVGSLQEVEDRRQWHPDAGRGAVTVGGRVARVVVHKRPVVAYSRPIYAKRGLPVGLQVPVGVMFESPLRVVRCLRRKIRREVIFAKDKIYHTRAKGSASKRRRRNPDSGVSC